MIFLIYMTLVILQCKGMATEVPDPCTSTIDKSIVADMCKSSSATEETQSGGYNVDSVVLRIITQQDNCICRVIIENQIQSLAIGLRKYDGHTSSAPMKAACGLAVDINHIPAMSTGNVTDPIKCVDNVDYRTFPLLVNSYLQFKSRIINGSFTRGYCMRITRDHNSKPTEVLTIECDAPTTTEQTAHQTIQSDPTTDASGRTTGETTIDGTETDISNDVVSPSIITATDLTTSNIINTVNTVNHDNAKSTGLEQTTYIGIGVGSGVALILLVVLVVICLRRKSTQKAGPNGNVNKSYQQEKRDDELQDNVLYVPATEFDITGGNYSTADVDTAKSSNKRLSMEGNYSTVDVDATNSSKKRYSMEGKYSTVGGDSLKSSTNRLSMDGNNSTVDKDTPKSSKNIFSMDGNYSTVELDEHSDRNCSYSPNSELGQSKGKHKPTIKPKPKSSYIKSEEISFPDQSIKHITPPNGSDNVYAIVDKSRQNVPTTNGGKEEGTCQPDQTYAVVDKARKRKSSPDKTNKKKLV